MIDLTERTSMPEMLTKVGPKGYIHGWIFVGAPGVGAEVYHPQHGRGVVTAHDGTHATVKFNRGGATHTFEAAHKPGAEHHFEPRGGAKVEAPKHHTDDLVAGKVKPKDLSDDELKASDAEFARRAKLMGREGDVGKTHQAVKDELKRRGGAGEKPSDRDIERAQRLAGEGKFAYPKAKNEANAASQAIDLRGLGAPGHRRAAELHRKAADLAPDKEAKDSHLQRAASHDREAAAAEKPSKPRSKVPGLTEEGAKEPKMDLGPYGTMHPADAALQHSGWGMNTEQLRSAKTELERRGVTEGGRDKVSQTHKRVTQELANSEAFQKEWNKPGGGADSVKADQAAKKATDAAKEANTPEAHEAAAKAHQYAKALAYKNDSRSVPYHNASADYHYAAAKNLRREQAFADARTEANRASEATEPAHRFTEEAPHRAAQAAHERAAAKALNEQDRAHHERIAAQHKTTADQNAAKQAERDRVNAEANAKRKAEQTEQQRAKGEAPADFTEADAATKKANRSGTGAAHAAAANAHAKIANDAGLSRADRTKARAAYQKHAKALENLDYAQESKDDAEIHADAAERTGDAEVHRKAAEAYREAADSMDEVPGGRKQAASLRAKAKEHDGYAADIDKRSADYVKRFTTAVKASNVANRTGNVDDRTSAAAAHRAASAASVTEAQRKYHDDEAADQLRQGGSNKSADTDLYWTSGEGADKIAWTSPGAYDRALTYLGKYLTDETKLREYCSQLYYQVLNKSAN